MIPQQDWIWFGSAGHFLGCNQCLFHLTTQIGNHVVSTVGEYYPKHLDCTKDDPETLSADCRYETMVFKVEGICKCGCELPHHNAESIEMEFCNTAKEARDIHMKLCNLVATW